MPPKYQIEMVRTVWERAFFEVDARNEHDAKMKAYNVAKNLDDSDFEYDECDYDIEEFELIEGEEPRVYSKEEGLCGRPDAREEEQNAS